MINNFILQKGNHLISYAQQLCEVTFSFLIHFSVKECE